MNPSGRPRLPRPLLAAAAAIAACSCAGFPGFCPYTSEPAPVPPELAGATLRLEQDAYLVTGKSPERCGGALASIEREIVSRNVVSGSTAGAGYFEDQGRSLEPLPAGATFTLRGVVGQRKHGLFAIDSGPGPLYYLLLDDAQGVRQVMGIASLGSGEAESTVSAWAGGRRVRELSWQYFERAYGQL